MIVLLWLWWDDRNKGRSRAPAEIAYSAAFQADRLLNPQKNEDVVGNSSENPVGASAGGCAEDKYRWHFQISIQNGKMEAAVLSSGMPRPAQVISLRNHSLSCRSDN